ncbi:AbgT family transporter [Bacteroidales bacterium OttesenSCG-928-I14]|nr:AbgT family transporter [Bacteroidales bacterium OttesenSCG-928-I14]
MFKKIPHTFTIVFFLIIIAAAMTWFIPSGEFARQIVETNGSTKEVVVGDSFHYIDSNPQTWQIFSAIFNGFVDKADIIIFILMVGGAFWILNNSKAIDIVVTAFLHKVRKLETHPLFRKINVNDIILVLIMLMFSIFGAVFGMSEETIAFVIIFVPLAISMGYDSIVGVSICYLAAHIGFAGAVLNPFTIGIAQAIAEVPLFSGLEYRLICWLIITFAGMGFVLWYAHRVKKYPEKSPMYKLDNYWRKRVEEQDMEETKYHTPKAAWFVGLFLFVVMLVFSYLYPMTSITIGHSTVNMPIIPILSGLYLILTIISLRKSVHFYILNILLFTILFLIVGVLGYAWYVMEIATLFFAMGIFSGIANSNSADQIAKLFLEGAKDIMNAALIVGLASGIIIILSEGKIIDTLLYGLTKSLAGLGETASIGAMYIFQTALNVIMPSGSAKAALTMPIMAQFADLINVSRQTAVLAFQFGDGFTNMITPTSGVLIGCLGVAKIPYTVWVKWIWKFLLGMIILGFLLLLPTLFISMNGF